MTLRSARVPSNCIAQQPSNTAPSCTIKTFEVRAGGDVAADLARHDDRRRLDWAVHHGALVARFDVDEDGNLSFTFAIIQLDDIPEKSEIIRLVQDAIEKKKSATALRSRDDEYRIEQSALRHSPRQLSSTAAAT
jgi:hypothetical protein